MLFFFKDEKQILITRNISVYIYIYIANVLKIQQLTSNISGYDVL